VCVRPSLESWFTILFYIFKELLLDFYLSNNVVCDFRVFKRDKACRCFVKKNARMQLKVPKNELYGRFNPYTEGLTRFWPSVGLETSQLNQVLSKIDLGEKMSNFPTWEVEKLIFQKMKKFQNCRKHSEQMLISFWNSSWHNSYMFCHWHIENVISQQILDIAYVEVQNWDKDRKCEFWQFEYEKFFRNRF